MWLCKECQIRHLDSSPACSQCGREKRIIAQHIDPVPRFLPDTVPPPEVVEAMREVRERTREEREFHERHVILDPFLRHGLSMDQKWGNLLRAWRKYRLRRADSSSPQRPERDRAWQRVALYALFVSLVLVRIASGFGPAPRGWLSIVALLGAATLFTSAVRRAVSLEIDSGDP